MWISVYDVDDNLFKYYALDSALNPLDTRKNVGNPSILVNPAHTYTVKILTRLGNSYVTEYPTPTDGGGGTGGTVETQYYYVDSMGDLYAPTSIGTYSLFNAMKAGPDHVNSTLTEEEIVTAPSSVDLISGESFEGSWPPTAWTSTGVWNKESNEVYDGSFSADFDGSGGGGLSGFLISPELDCSDADYITVDFWFYDDNLDGNEITLWYWSGFGWNEIESLSTVFTEDVWHNYQETVTNPQYFIDNFQILFWANGVDNNEHGYIDLVTVSKGTSGSSYYDMDLEATWTELPITTNKYLTIVAGEQSSEELRVDYWDGGGWVNLINDVNTGYNVVDVSSVLSGSSFTIRFTDTDGTGDNTESNWDIDAVYLNLFD
jgi:hypothetical protein